MIDASDNQRYFTSALPALENLWRDLELPDSALATVTLTGCPQPLPSSFAVGTTAQASIAAAAAMSGVIAQQRGINELSVTVDSVRTALECSGYFKLNGVAPPQFAPLSGLYETKDGHIRLHANFDHHRDIALRCMGLPAGAGATRAQLQEKFATVDTHSADQSITSHGGACSALRSFAQWDEHPQALALRKLPLIEITRIGDAPAKSLAILKPNDLPLDGIRVLDLTRILAGPVCGRTLAAYGADVMLINSPELPNIESIADTSRGKLSAHIDLQSETGRQTLHALIKSSHVFIQGYRPAALDQFGFGAMELARRYPGIIYTSLSAYGRSGPWCERRGFDSLVQTATGFNYAEAEAFGSPIPKPLPVQVLDYATGFLMAFATQVALQRQALEGGSYHVQLSLARTGQWLRDMGRSNNYLEAKPVQTEDHLLPYASGFGELAAIPHAAEFMSLNTNWRRPSVPPGSNPPRWPSIC